MNSENLSYSSSLDYIIKTQCHFNYSVYYNNFCCGFTREQTKEKIKKDLEECLFEVDCNNYETTKWVKEQLELDIPIINTTTVDNFWIILNEKKNFSIQKSNESIRRNLIEQEHQANLNVCLNSTLNNSDSIRVEESSHNVIESDAIVMFDGRSVASILKSYGKKHFYNYDNLNENEKNTTGYCLNGILDLTNDSQDSQKKLFTQEQWDYLHKKFNSKKLKHLPRISKKNLKVIDKIIKYIKDGKTEKAYNKSLIQITKASKDEKFIFKIISHVINAYNERSYIFIADEKSVTELDYITKIWSELLELLFGNESTIIKWGESVSQLTTNMKFENNNKKSNTIGFKVDARIICKVDTIIDVCNVEAAKSANDDKKVYSDKFKLSVESKCIVDNIVLNSDYKALKSFSIQNLQICGIQAEVCSLALVDSGLYVHNLDYDLSLPQSLDLFADTIIYWIRKLMSFRNSCLSISKISSYAINPSPKSLSTSFSRDDTTQQSPECNPSWVRGTFFSPTKADPIPHFPSNFLSSSTMSSSKRKCTSQQPIVKKRKV